LGGLLIKGAVDRILNKCPLLPNSQNVGERLEHSGIVPRPVVDQRPACFYPPREHLSHPGVRARPIRCIIAAEHVTPGPIPGTRSHAVIQRQQNVFVDLPKVAEANACIRAERMPLALNCG
jgi:hypothetical protein